MMCLPLTMKSINREKSYNDWDYSLHINHSWCNVCMYYIFY